MHIIIIGDIVNSRQVDADLWLPVLEEALKRYAQKFDIFRGDSFQAELPVADCFKFVFYVKARIRSLAPLDVRLGIGIGDIAYSDDSIRKSNGSAFIYAGEAFDALGKDML